MRTFAIAALDVSRSMSGRDAEPEDPRLISLMASADAVRNSVHALARQAGVRTAAADKDAEWQRVNSYVADVLKDAHVLYAKLARLQGDFIGDELTALQGISESVLALGEELSHFSKAFYEGQLQMAETNPAYGNQGGGAPQGGSQGGGQPDIPVQIEGEGQEGVPSQGGGQRQAPPVGQPQQQDQG